MWKAIEQRLKSSFLLQKRLERTAGGRRYGCWYVITRCLPERRKRSVWWSEADSAGWSFSWHPIWRGVMKDHWEQLWTLFSCVLHCEVARSAYPLQPEWVAHNSKGTPRNIYYKYFEYFNPLQTTESKSTFLYNDFQFWKNIDSEFSRTLYGNAYVNCDL